MAAWNDADKPRAAGLVNGIFKANAVIYDRLLSASRGREVAHTDQGWILDGALTFRPAPLSFLSSPTIAPPLTAPLPAFPSDSVGLVSQECGNSTFGAKAKPSWEKALLLVCRRDC